MPQGDPVETCLGSGQPLPATFSASRELGRSDQEPQVCLCSLVLPEPQECPKWRVGLLTLKPPPRDSEAPSLQPLLLQLPVQVPLANPQHPSRLRPIPT